MRFRNRRPRSRDKDHYFELASAKYDDPEQAIVYEENDLLEWSTWTEQNEIVYHQKAKKRYSKGEAVTPLLRQMDAPYQAITGHSLLEHDSGSADPTHEHESSTAPSLLPRHQHGEAQKASLTRFSH
jgi:hypothetical protein